MSAGGEQPPLGSRLDPDRAVAEAQPPRPPPEPPSPVDTRRYRWAIGIFGLTIVLVLSVYEFAQRGVGSPGVAPGKRLHRFVAPLTSSGTNLDANAAPRCDPRRPNPRGLNVCGTAPIVLAFFVTKSTACERQVDALQAVSGRPTFKGIQFAAVAVHTGRVDAAAAVRRHHWTIPVAYDRDGSIGDLYGIEICPLVEVAAPGGVVLRRLIGGHWSTPAALATQLQAVVRR